MYLHVSTCVYMCCSISTYAYLYPYKCTFRSFVHVYMYKLLEHNMVFHHCVSPIWSLCYSLFADTVFCTLCSVLIVYDIMICYCICYCFWYPFSLMIY